MDIRRNCSIEHWERNESVGSQASNAPRLRMTRSNLFPSTRHSEGKEYPEYRVKDDLSSAASSYVPAVGENGSNEGAPTWVRALREQEKLLMSRMRRLRRRGPLSVASTRSVMHRSVTDMPDVPSFPFPAPKAFNEAYQSQRVPADLADVHRPAYVSLPQQQNEAAARVQQRPPMLQRQHSNFNRDARRLSFANDQPRRKLSTELTHKPSDQCLNNVSLERDFCVTQTVSVEPGEPHRPFVSSPKFTQKTSVSNTSAVKVPFTTGPVETHIRHPSGEREGGERPNVLFSSAPSKTTSFSANDVTTSNVQSFGAEAIEPQRELASSASGTSITIAEVPISECGAVQRETEVRYRGATTEQWNEKAFNHDQGKARTEEAAILNKSTHLSKVSLGVSTQSSLPSATIAEDFKGMVPVNKAENQQQQILERKVSGNEPGVERVSFESVEAKCIAESDAPVGFHSVSANFHKPSATHAPRPYESGGSSTQQPGFVEVELESDDVQHVLHRLETLANEMRGINAEAETFRLKTNKLSNQQKAAQTILETLTSCVKHIQCLEADLASPVTGTVERFRNAYEHAQRQRNEQLINLQATLQQLSDAVGNVTVEMSSSIGAAQAALHGVAQACEETSEQLEHNFGALESTKRLLQTSSQTIGASQAGSHESGGLTREDIQSIRELTWHRHLKLKTEVERMLVDESREYLGSLNAIVQRNPTLSATKREPPIDETSSYVALNPLESTSSTQVSGTNAPQPQPSQKPGSPTISPVVEEKADGIANHSLATAASPGSFERLDSASITYVDNTDKPHCLHNAPVPSGAQMTHFQPPWAYETGVRKDSSMSDRVQLSNQYGPAAEGRTAPSTGLQLLSQLREAASKRSPSLLTEYHTEVALNSESSACSGTRSSAAHTPINAQEQPAETPAAASWPSVPCSSATLNSNQQMHHEQRYAVFRTQNSLTPSVQAPNNHAFSQFNDDEANANPFLPDQQPAQALGGSINTGSYALVSAAPETPVGDDKIKELNTNAMIVPTAPPTAKPPLSSAGKTAADLFGDTEDEFDSLFAPHF